MLLQTISPYKANMLLRDLYYRNLIHYRSRNVIISKVTRNLYKDSKETKHICNKAVLPGINPGKIVIGHTKRSLSAVQGKNLTQVCLQERIFLGCKKIFLRIVYAKLL